jgi:hypothetical protein
LGTAKGSWDGAKYLGADNPDAISPSTISFNQKRMRSQQVGVLNDEPTDSLPGMPKATPPQDPLQFAQSQVCPPSK